MRNVAAQLVTPLTEIVVDSAVVDPPLPVSSAVISGANEESEARASAILNTRTGETESTVVIPELTLPMQSSSEAGIMFADLLVKNARLHDELKSAHKLIQGLKKKLELVKTLLDPTTTSSNITPVSSGDDQLSAALADDSNRILDAPCNVFTAKEPSTEKSIVGVAETIEGSSDSCEPEGHRPSPFHKETYTFDNYFKSGDSDEAAPLKQKASVDSGMGSGEALPKEDNIDNVHKNVVEANDFGIDTLLAQAEISVTSVNQEPKYSANQHQATTQDGEGQEEQEQNNRNCAPLDFEGRLKMLQNDEFQHAPGWGPNDGFLKDTREDHPAIALDYRPHIGRPEVSEDLKQRALSQEQRLHGNSDDGVYQSEGNDPEILPERCHPVRVGETIKSGRYVVAKKLSQGEFSTIWLAKDQQYFRHQHCFFYAHSVGSTNTNPTQPR